VRPRTVSVRPVIAIVVAALVGSVALAVPARAADAAILANDFESDSYAPWLRSGGATLTVMDVDGGGKALAVTNRTKGFDGVQSPAGAFTPGVTHTFSVRARLAAGGPASSGFRFVMKPAYTWIGNTTITADAWTTVTGEFTVPADADPAGYQVYLEAGEATASYLIDDIIVRLPQAPVVQDLTGIREATGFPVGVAIDSREAQGAAGDLLTRHFNRITAENHMKPDAWYDAARNFRPHPQAIALMDFAQANNLGVYGHVLVWHSQVPAWFFQDDAGVALTSSEAHQQMLRDRLHTHIFGVAKELRDRYGLFGSATNPLDAFDVVNEVVSDSSEFADGLRRSEWYRILGENFIDLAFRYADEAFNDVNAVAGADPVTLFINDYNTEQTAKQARYKALVERLIARGVPIDGVGHQFHVSLATPVSNLDAALTAFANLPVIQAVTEFDVPTGTPVTQAKLIDQGYYVRDAFRVFGKHADDLFTVTVWGLTDSRSWRSGSGAPLIFNDGYQAKPAYYGAVDGALPPRPRAADVFAGDVAVSAGATTSLEWSKLPLFPIENTARFQLRWAPDHLTTFVTVSDDTTSAGDKVSFVVAGSTYTVSRNGTGDVPAVVTKRNGGYDVVAHLPLTTAAQGGTLPFDVQVSNNGTSSGWNTPGAVGTLTLVEPLSYLEVMQTPRAPVIDGAADGVWADAVAVTTGKQVSGSRGAVATVRTLWHGQTLYLRAEVADPAVDVSGSDPWIQDSMEIYVDAGNAKNGAYRPDDMQIRINADNAVSFGAGDESAQRKRVTSAVVRTGAGYTVEAAINLLEYGGVGTLHGLDFQVNDAAGGTRTAIRNWAEQRGIGYQTTAHWGVGRLVAHSNVDIELKRSTSWGSDSGGGYCADIVATNRTDRPVVWNGVVIVEGDIFTSWNVKRQSLGEGIYRIGGVGWIETLAPGASTYSVGYCATL
jgi:endo-1,4-beta-xylanase